ncbi:hypothetical protein [Candidatus Nitrososphaera evergladensis]|uniref:hypothetical protein n=1 Tax=Candidatus Nitrososphaera evergladensis TaxID=1459637 RepID=UPI00130EF61E|nr:hypothetical protein [Candidatus Nitrososphaera evergladensis]
MVAVVCAKASIEDGAPTAAVIITDATAKPTTNNEGIKNILLVFSVRLDILKKATDDILKVSVEISSDNFVLNIPDIFPQDLAPSSGLTKLKRTKCCCYTCKCCLKRRIIGARKRLAHNQFKSILDAGTRLDGTDYVALYFLHAAISRRLEQTSQPALV